MAVLLQGGRVIDPASELDRVADVLCVDGVIAAIGPDLASQPDLVPADTEVVDCRGQLVTPGLIDLHVHVMPGLGDFCVRADDVGVGMGVPMLIDGGTSGVATFDLARAAVIDHPSTRTEVLAFIDPNQLYLATKDFICHKLELANDVRNIDIDALDASMERNADIIVGLKVRACHTDDPNHSPFLEAAQRSSQGKPVMVHLGRFPHTPTIPTPRLLEALRPGDIITHAFRGAGGMLDADGTVIPEFVDAVERGVRLDVGHSGTDFRFSDARKLFDQGYFPDTISTDLNIFNVGGPVYSLAETMTKILTMGVDLVDVIGMCTSNTADVIGRGDRYGRLEVGRRAHVSVLSMESDPIEVSDGKVSVTAHEWFRPVGCVSSGRWYDSLLDRTAAAA
ncbi:MAG: amidohydrolase/deacetylase family metallohydrolase [Ilumatobacter sp.]|uniref:amidohydrolase/deacetylase family metallohydrolase n=1 Tax=Ilumatobacter sp. TaxID=1967498 RepID=UPI003298B8D5